MIQIRGPLRLLDHGISGARDEVRTRRNAFDLSSKQCAWLVFV
jgi:hypothetical protein